ncbi:MAG: right-handed parallel beta-helix repeat-containing protein [Methanobrevibacter ruminantium]|uniref:right-handed parallel beta-helix repeat-containing protein n=1 Tax=Methanobrevibacter ruminantium TaxID=83816 RepID=UPI0026ED45C1|nr:right-handed parallel beta-helix repeat-containing protein [Methanobrevibacter ruminantium]MDO5842136.1 right-handed parallel beta-helix repeat-containing protein [Methanobrevibacter ruminantium]
MKLNKFTVVLVVLLISILAIGAVSAESVDDAGIVAVGDGDIQESVEVTDTADDLSTADNADEIVNDDSGAAIGEGTNSYDLDDDTYSRYFNDDGTATEDLSADGDYTLNIGTLTNKDIKITSGSNINITAKEGAGFINNGTIYLDGGYDGLVGSVTISGLTFTNTNKGAIDIAQFSTDINIKGNTINIVGEDITSITALAPHDFIYGLNIIDNKVNVTGDASYTNGIYAMNWASADTPSNFNISRNTFYIESSATSGSHAAVYIECTDSVIENNDITVKSLGKTCAYGIQVPDSEYLAYMYGSCGAKSPSNFNITNNRIKIDTENMAYGITYLSYGVDGTTDDYDMPLTATFPLNVNICENEVVINSKKGAIGIGGLCYNMTVTDNDVTVIAGSPQGVTTSDSLGAFSCALLVMYDDLNEDEETYEHINDYRIFIENNKVLTNVTGEFITDSDYLEYVTFDNNIFKIQDDEGNFIVTPETFDVFFDENGNFIFETADGSTVLIDALTDKNMVFNQKLNIGAKEGSGVITNGTITLTADASGSVIDGLTFDYTGASNLITLADGISDVTVSNNIIKFNSTGRYAAAIAAANWGYGPISNMKIVSNKIDVICENAAAYAIDVAGGWGQKTVTDSLISQNNITIQANGMAEAIYVCSASNFNITENNITATSEAGASYGIAADYSDNIGITGNTIDSTSKQAAYGIANTHNADNTISDNKITVEGASAIGVGVGFDTGSVIEGNTIDVNASDDYASTPTSDSALGTGNSGIKLTNNATATISNNFVSSNGAQMDLDGASADTNVGTNYVAMTGNPEDVLSPVATTISVASATVTADPNGAGKTRNIAITVKDANGKAVADQTLKVYVNGALKTVKTNADGVATLAVAYKAAGTTTLVASFDGATGVLGSSAVGKLTVKKNAVKMAAKTKKVKKSQASKAKVKFTLKVGKTALKKKVVTIKINKKTYKAKTNAKGIVTFKVKLPKKVKKYSYTVKFAGDKFCNAKTLKGKLTVK